MQHLMNSQTVLELIASLDLRWYGTHSEPRLYDKLRFNVDYKVRSRMVDVAPGLLKTSFPTFNKKEFQAMIDESHSRGVKVATHSVNWAMISRPRGRYCRAWCRIHTSVS